MYEIEKKVRTPINPINGHAIKSDIMIAKI